jgi:hypothetical protein
LHCIQRSDVLEEDAMADMKSTTQGNEPEGVKAGAHPSGVKDDPSVTAATKKAAEKSAEIEKDKTNPSAPGNTGTTPGTNADIG